MKQPDPEKDDQVYAADLTGTLITLLPGDRRDGLPEPPDDEGRAVFKLETDTKLLPKEGTAAKLVVQASQGSLPRVFSFACSLAKLIEC